MYMLVYVTLCVCVCVCVSVCVCVCECVCVCSEEEIESSSVNWNRILEDSNIRTKKCWEINFDTRVILLSLRIVLK